MEDNKEITFGTEKFDGPGGVWTLRQQFNAKNVMNKNFRPACNVDSIYEQAYSFKKLKEHLMAIHPSLTEQILALPMSEFIAATTSRPPTPPLAPFSEQPTFPGLSVPMDTEPLLPLFDLPPLAPAVTAASKFSLTADSVLVAATNMMASFTDGTPNIFYDIPKGVITAFESWGTFNIPLIVGTLPFPSIPSQFYMKQTWRIEPAHAVAIETGLTPEYLDHMRDVAINCDVGVFEMYSKRKMIFQGGLILARFDILHAGQHIPAICIESIVAVKKHKNIGKYLFNFCKEMLFESNDTASYGFIFAQCVDIPFWEVIVSRL
jgi:hypothetical protein